MRGLLDAHGIEAIVASALSPSVFPMRLRPGGVPRQRARRRRPAARASSSPGHLDEAAAAEVRRLSETLGPLEEAIDYSSATSACSSTR